MRCISNTFKRGSRFLTVLLERAIFSLVMEQIFKKWYPNVCNIQMQVYGLGKKEIGLITLPGLALNYTPPTASPYDNSWVNMGKLF